jgi:hypothetical protein
MTAEELLPRVKQNLILDDAQSDDFLLGIVASAISYAEQYQNHEMGYYESHPMPPTTEQAVIMLSSHWFEARDGSTGGFYADNVQAAQQVWRVVNDLLRISREWKV